MNEKSTVHIGLKLADGSFYPVFEESFRGSKRLVLTTVHDNQKSVQIDIYKGLNKEVFEDAYIGSLVIENLSPSKKGAAEIELVMGIDESGNLNAQARDSSSGEQQVLSVSLESLAQRSDYEIPEFDIDQAPPVQSDETMADETIAGEPYPTGEEDSRRSYAVKDKDKRNPLAVILLILLGLILLAAIAGAVIYFFFPSIPRQLGILPAETAAIVEPSPSPTPAEEPIVTEIETPSPSPEAASPAPATEAPPAASGKGVWYKVIWGDTLWDLSRQYYRDPFQYMKIADAPENTIPNPDLIFEHQRIFIPDK